MADVNPTLSKAASARRGTLGMRRPGVSVYPHVALDDRPHPGAWCRTRKRPIRGGPAAIS